MSNENIRILNNLAGPGIDYRPNDVVSVDSGVAAQLIASPYAIKEGPSPSGTIATLYTGAGYQHTIPVPGGYASPSGFIPTAPVGGGYYFTGDYVFTVCFPGKPEVTFDLLKLRPPEFGE